MTANKILRGPEAGLIQTPIPMLDLAQPTIPFQRLALPESSLTFLPRSSVPHSRKRGRVVADVDGEHSCTQKKKRRLRLFLITSRLSPQFSHPATNIVDRGSSKIALWAKQKAAGRNLLPKAAILNCIRRGAVAARDSVSRKRLLVEQEKEQQQLELARLTFNYGAIHTYTRPVHAPTEPIPLSASVRDANLHLISGSKSVSPSTSPATSRSPSPNSISPPLNDATADYTSPNAAYALSPPRIQHSNRTYEPHLPSPLGLSNYDALDVEDPGAKHGSAVDMYSHLDDDDDGDEEDRYSFLWNDDDDDDDNVDLHDRHDSPFSVSVDTTDSLSTAHTTASQALATPPQQAHDAFGLEGLGTAGDAGPAGWCGAAKAKKVSRGSSGGVNPRFECFAAGPLAVQYPGAPVPVEEQRDVVSVAPVRRVDMVPASMSPNFLAADGVGWGEVGEGKG